LCWRRGHPYDQPKREAMYEWFNRICGDGEASRHRSRDSALQARCGGVEVFCQGAAAGWGGDGG
jgi:hypothetical protein